MAEEALIGCMARSALLIGRQNVGEHLPVIYRAGSIVEKIRLKGSMMIDPIHRPPVPQRPAAVPDRDPERWRTAQSLEASFLSEMLGQAGLGENSGGFGEGIGADQFASFLRQGEAEAMVRAGGVGLAESFYRAMGKHNG